MIKTKKFKILLTLRTDILLGAGTEKVALYYAKYLPKEKWVVSILTTDLIDYQRMDPSALIRIGIENIYQIHSVENKFYFFKKIPYLGPGIFEFLQYIITFLNKFINRKTINQIGKYDLIYHMYFLTPLITRGCSAINVVSEHTLSARRKNSFISTFIYCLHFLFLHKNNFLHALSNKLLRDSYAGLPVKTIGNGYDSEIFYPRPIAKPENVNFAFLARLEPGKGLMTVLKSWKIARKKGLGSSFLHIVGTGSLSHFILDFDDPTIIYHGRLSNEEVATILGKCDFFIYPSIADMFPLVVLEALGSGCHVLTTTYLKGVFDEEKSSGYLEYLERSDQAFATRILEVTDSVSRYRAERSLQVEKIKNNYEWRNVVSRFSDFLLNVTER